MGDSLGLIVGDTLGVALGKYDGVELVSSCGSDDSFSVGDIIFLVCDHQWGMSKGSMLGVM